MNFELLYLNQYDPCERMSLSDTSRLIEESRRIVEASSDQNADPTAILQMILSIVTNIENRMKNMETNIEKRLENIKKEMLNVSARVRSLEGQADNFRKQINECEKSCEGVANLLDKAEDQIKRNTRNIIHQDIRIQKLEQQPKFQPVIQPVTEAGEIRKLKEDILDLKCRSMKNNLIFTGLHRVRNENTESLLRCFLENELGIDYHIEFGNVHRFKSPNSDFRRSPIVARFLYHKDLEYILSIETALIPCIGGWCKRKTE